MLNDGGIAEQAKEPQWYCWLFLVNFAQITIRGATNGGQAWYVRTFVARTAVGANIEQPLRWVVCCYSCMLCQQVEARGNQYNKCTFLQSQS
jgi:hypothetical protein